jgi:integrase
LACAGRTSIFGRQCLRLPDSKTGQKIVYLNAPALSVLNELPRVRGNPHVIVGSRLGAPLRGIDKTWFRVRRNAKLDNLRLHDLGHSGTRDTAASPTHAIMRFTAAAP